MYNRIIKQTKKQSIFVKKTTQITDYLCPIIAIKKRKIILFI